MIWQTKTRAIPRKRSPWQRASYQPRMEHLESREVPTTLPAGFSESLVASGLGSVTAMAVAPGAGDGRVFVTTQSGDVRVIKNGALLATPFFHFNNIDGSGERGVLGVAFDPSFTSNHFVYIYHTVAAAGGNAPFNEVSRFTVSGDVAAAGSQVDILKLNDLSGATNHNGGAMHFGTDNLLYISVGENANPANSQTLNNLLGKVLRIDVSQVAPGDPLNNVAKLIPASNPFTPGHTSVASGINQAIYALGLRNPFTFGVDPATGATFISDVGQNTWEEINRLVAGANYGWNNAEGFFNGTPSGLGPGTYMNPLMSYNHNNASPTTITGIAIIGGVAYEPPPGATNPFPSSFNGKYFFADLGGGFNHDHSQNLGQWIRVFDPASPGSLANPDTSQNFASSAANSIVGLVQAPDGGIYYLSAGSGGGEVLKISFNGTPQPPTITQQPANQTVTQGNAATFMVTASGTGTLSYQWQRNNGAGGSFVNISGATSTTLTVSNVQPADNGAQFRVIVTNTGGSVTSNVATLAVTANHAPVGTITINSGLRNGNFDAGTPIGFTLSATDQEDGTEPASRFTYKVEFVTSLNSIPGGEVRPFVPLTSGVASASFTPATTGPYTLTDILYRITFTVSDANGLASTVVRDVAPNTVTITEQSNPTGLQLLVDGQSQTAPTSFASVVGFVRVLNAPTTQVLSGVTYNFGSWSDGGAAQHNVTTPTTNVTFTATYNAAVPTAPTNLTATAVSTSQINLAWTDASNNESGFQVQRATDSGFTQNLVTSNLGANVTSFQSTGLAASTTYFYRVRAVNGPANSVFSNTASATTQTAPAGFVAKINFQDTTSQGFAGYLADTGAVFGDRGNGFSYGWNISNATTARNRNAANSPDERYDTLEHLQKPENPNAVWESAVPNGTYTVHVVSGDPNFIDSVFRTNVEGTLAVSGTPTAATHWFEGTVTVTVTDGRLTVSNGAGASNNKINFIDITQQVAAPPAFQQGGSPDFLVVMEAENASANVSQGAKSWVAYSATAGFAGASAMITTANTGINNDTGYVAASPRLDFQVNFTQTGTHYVWIRGIGPTGSDDSVHVGIDGVANTTADRISTFSTAAYSWTNSTMDGVRATINVTTAGLHTINLWMREDGTIADRILLTTNASFTPTGTGPAESPRGSGGTGGSGLTATYFDNIDFTGPTVTRVDPTVNFDFGTGSPAAAIGADSFSVRWLGKIRPQYSEAYTFYTTSDDGVRLRINGQLVIDQWNDHAATVHSGTVTLQAGQLYDIQLEYYENGGFAVMKLEWQSPSQPRGIVPANYLYAV